MRITDLQDSDAENDVEKKEEISIGPEYQAEVFRAGSLSYD